MSENHGYNTNPTDSAGQEKQHDDDARTSGFGSGKWQLTYKSVTLYVYVGSIILSSQHTTSYHQTMINHVMTKHFM